MICAAAMRWDGLQEAEDEIARLRRRDSDAFAAAIARYQHRLYGYLLRMTGEPADAEDLFQQTWLRVVEQIGRYDAARSFDVWLFSIAHNLAVDHLRRKRPGSLDAVPDPPAAPRALDGLLEAERAAMLSAAVAGLPVLWRETLALRFQEDMKLEEIAAAVHAPLSTVKSRLRRALAYLRGRMRETRYERA